MKPVVFVTANLMTLTMAVPAIAEVCDKVRPAWRPQDGQIGQLEDVAFFFAQPSGLLVLAVAAVALAIRAVWLSAVAVIALLALVAIVISEWLWPDDITTFAILEGCVTTPVATTTVLIGLAAAIAAITQRRAT